MLVTEAQLRKLHYYVEDSGFVEVYETAGNDKSLVVWTTKHEREGVYGRLYITPEGKAEKE